MTIVTRDDLKSYTDESLENIKHVRSALSAYVGVMALSGTSKICNLFRVEDHSAWVKDQACDLANKLGLDASDFRQLLDTYDELYAADKASAFNSVLADLYADREATIKEARARIWESEKEAMKNIRQAAQEEKAVTA